MDWKEEENIVKVEMDATKDLINAAVFEARKKLKFSNPDAPISFSLINLHKHFLGYPPEQSHGAEADCLSLLRTTAALGIEWINWVKENCYKFESCKRMWGQSKVQTSVIANIF